MKLTKGKDLTQAQRQEVKRAYIYRWTGEHTPAPHVKEGMSRPTHATDNEWIDDHAFYIDNNGKLSNAHKHCEPVYMAE